MSEITIQEIINEMNEDFSIHFKEGEKHAISFEESSIHDGWIECLEKYMSKLVSFLRLNGEPKVNGSFICNDPNCPHCAEDIQQMNDEQRLP